MTKLLGTIISLFMLVPTMAQKTRKPLVKDSTNRFSDSIRSLPPLEIRSLRVNESSPFAKTNLSKAAIGLVNVGQDLPFIIQNTPSVVVSSDAGNGVGYTGIRIRGTDATRINVTLNGIPYNDAESMGTYFVDLPDFGSSLNSIQIQRGVGTSSNGAGSFGATLNLATNDYKPSSYLSFQNSMGSFHTLRNTLMAGTGLLKNHFTIDGRLSKINSDGYIDRAKSKLSSYYLSSTYWAKKSSLRLNIFSGKEKTYQAWYGVPSELLSTQRTYNPAGMEKLDNPYDNQTDNYVQTHYQLFYNYQVNTYLKWNTALFLTRGKGYYEEYKASVDPQDYGVTTLPKKLIDLVRRRWLDNHFYGQIASLSYEKDKNLFILGGGWSQYNGLHYGSLPYLVAPSTSNDYKYYNNKGTKFDVNSYVKWQNKITTQLISFIDIQYRFVAPTMNGFDANPTLKIDRNFNFFNPKMGITYSTLSTNYYTSIAIAHKEPNRDDFEAGKTLQPKSEKLIDLETGFNSKFKNFEWGANFYYMHYKDQLVLTGKINDVGSYNRTNVPLSYRMGIELEEKLNLGKNIISSGNITWSKNKINKFTEYFDDYDNGGQKSVQHSNTAIALSPNLIAAHNLTWVSKSQFQIALVNKYVSKQYLDNTQNESRILNAYFLTDLNIAYPFMNKLKWSAQVQFYLNNIFDTLYEPNGYTYSYFYGGAVTTSNNFYPMAGRNYWLSLKINLK